MEGVRRYEEATKLLRGKKLHDPFGGPNISAHERILERATREAPSQADETPKGDAPRQPEKPEGDPGHEGSRDAPSAGGEPKT
jgi:hypothetical protein